MRMQVLWGGESGQSVRSPGTGVTGAHELPVLDGNPPRVPWKSSACSLILSHLSSPSAQRFIAPDLSSPGPFSPTIKQKRHLATNPTDNGWDSHFWKEERQ